MKKNRRHKERCMKENRRHEERCIKEDRRHAERHNQFPEDDNIDRITICR